MSKNVQNRAAVAAAKRPGQFLREVVVELSKVKWPSRHEVTQLTSVVIITILAVGAYVALLDFVFGWVFRQIGMYN